MVRERKLVRTAVPLLVLIGCVTLLNDLNIRNLDYTARKGSVVAQPSIDCHYQSSSNNNTSSIDISGKSCGYQQHVPSREDRTSDFAACLLIMDDNEILAEWLAYHYHALPLRHLIVAIDPRSETSPLPILIRYRGLMNISMWSDLDFTTNSSELEAAVRHNEMLPEKGRLSPILARHRARQRLFYYKCMQDHKRSNRTWTMLTDTDEFLTVNYDTVTKLRPTAAPPVPIDQPGSVMKLLQQEDALYQRENSTSSSPCVQIPRSRFGTVETNTSILEASVPLDLDIDATLLSTIRWRHHAALGNYNMNKISKAVINLSRVEWNQLIQVQSIHRPIKAYCTQRKLHIRAHEQLFLIHHYLPGTSLQYTSRNDARSGAKDERNIKQYGILATLNEGTSDIVTPWLSGFVSHVGTTLAEKLLSPLHNQNVGDTEQIFNLR